MAQERFITPEKQLLKLIEDQKSKDVKVQVHAVKHQGLSFLSFAAWQGRISFLKDNFRKWSGTGGFNQLDIKTINNIFGICVVILILYLVINLGSYIANMVKGPNLAFVEEQTSAKPVTSFQGISALKNAASYYIEKARQRDIFKMGETRSKVLAQETAPKSTIPKIVEATQHLKLVGISWSADPDAMIEDTQAMRTLFVKRGQMIGDVEVRAIFKDKVVLSYGGEETELK